MSNQLSQVPPQNLEAEESILAACLISPESCEEIVDLLTPEHFYKSAHGKLFAAIIELKNKYQPVDLITVSNLLRSRGELEQVGGASYISSMIDNVPMATNALHYAEIVRDKAAKRLTIKHCNEITKNCFADSEPAIDIIDVAQNKMLSIELSDPGKVTFLSMNEIMYDSIDTLDERFLNKGKLTGVPTGFHQIDELTWGLQKTDLIIIAARPSMGKTSLSLNIARHAAIDCEEKYPVGIFSLEMSKQQLSFKFMADLAKINTQKFKNGYFSREDWVSITGAAGRLAGSPIFIDDSSGLTINEIRRRARQMWKRHKIKLIIVDYIQLMSGSGSKQQNREREISEISTGLKNLAKELELPVIGISQLNRKVEDRNDKKPRMADLRDSGCLAGNTIIYSHNHKFFKTMKSLDNDVVGMIDSNKKHKGSIMSIGRKCFTTGQKQFYKIKLITGHEIEATKTHKFLIPGREWCELDSLKIGGMVGVPLNFKHSKKTTLSDAEIKMAALFLGNGCSLPRRSLQYTSHSEDLDLCEEIQIIANNICGGELRPYLKHQIYRENTDKESTAINVFFPAKRQVSRRYRNPLVLFFEKIGMYGKRHSLKEIPGEIFNQTVSGKRLFIKYLWATDGTICAPKKGNKTSVVLAFSSSSIAIIKQLQFLLQSVGILSTTSKVIKNNKYITYNLYIKSRYFMNKFIHDIGVAGIRKNKVAREAVLLLNKINPGWTKYELSDDKSIAYVPIKTIEKTSIGQAYDIEVAGTHNFFANGIIVHNSLEQDADTIAFVYRDEVYNTDKNNPLRGTADIIIAKNRNGPTGTARLAFVDKYASFYNLAGPPEDNRY